MARMYPSFFPLSDDSSRWAEKTTYEAFSTLDDEWTVIYSLRWLGHRDGGNSDGEADFLLLHPVLGILVVEVKGGSEILVREGQWFSQSRGQMHAIKDPFAQASDSKFALLRWLRKELPGIGLPHIGHLVVFPSHVQDGDISPAGRREIICDRRDLESVSLPVERAARFTGTHPPTTNEVIEAIRKKLVPDVKIHLSDWQSVTSALQTIEALTEQQQSIMESVHLNPRMVVRGAAGTGKTVLALNSAIRSATTGHKTLLLCYNKPLARHLRSIAGDQDNLVIDNIDSFATRIVGDMGEDTSDLDLLPYQLADIVSEIALKYDSVFVDEAQDFREDWWEPIESLLKDKKKSKLHLFLDANQNIYEGSGVERFETAHHVELTINCRNTRQIAIHVNRLAGLDTPTKAAVGPEPSFVFVDENADGYEQILGLINQMKEEYGLQSSEIVVLTDSSKAREDITDFIESLDSPNSQVHVETIHRFKGLESQAVICCFHSQPNSQDTADVYRLGYIGLSRAKVVLAVLGTADILTKLGSNP